MIRSAVLLSKQRKLQTGLVAGKAVRKMDTLAFLGECAPAFAVRGCQVKVLTDPQQFYSQLCNRAANSKERIVMSALYLGTGEKAQHLVNCVQQSLQSSRRPRTLFLLDFCRGNRLIGDSSSVSMLRPLLQDFENSCAVSLYHTPDLRGIKKRLLPDKFNETIGLQHCKLYVFDNSVLISGANLSQDYFTNRQDRYIVIEDCAPLATFCEELVRKISQFSLHLKKDGSFQVCQGWKGGHPVEGDYAKYKSAVKQSLMQFIEDYKVKHKLKGNFLPSSNTGVEGGSKCEDEEDTWIFPSIQMGAFDVRHDSDLTQRFLQSSSEVGTKFKFATGYFNITSSYQKVLLDSKAQFQVLAAHPKANGFLGASFPAGGIPSAYSLILQQFLDSVIKKKSEARIQVFEYLRPKWTFHAKGLWFYLPGSTYPCATMVGSANFGYRSVEKDLEAQMTIVTRNQSLAQKLHHEAERLFETSEVVTEKTLTTRHIPLWVKSVVAYFPKLF